MAKLNRVTQSIFGAAASDIGVFGSAQAGAPTLSTNIATIMGLAAWSQGWLAAVEGGSKFPCLEEINAVDYVTTSQLAYLFQQGFPEYDAGTTYYNTSMAIKPGTYQIYASQTNGNIGNPLTNGTYWKLLLDLGTAGSQALAGEFRNLTISNSSTTVANIAADEIVVESALGGTVGKISSFTGSINTATVGVGGMDVGVPIASQPLYFYAIKGPGVADQVIACTTYFGTIYTGAHMPAGYTQSALISCTPVLDGSAHFVGFLQYGREVFLSALTAVLSNSTGSAGFYPQSLSSVVPAGAKAVSGFMRQTLSGATSGAEIQCTVAGDSTGTSGQYGTSESSTNPIGVINTLNFVYVPVITSQTLYWKSNDGRTNSVTISISGYKF